MSRFAAFALSLAAGACCVAGCASAEDANTGGEHDLAALAAPDDLAAADLANDGGAPALTCGAGLHVVVNEVQVGSAASASDEFIELYNPCAVAVELAGSTLVYRAAGGVTDVIIISLTKPIAAGGYYLVTGPVFGDLGAPDQSYGSGHLAAVGGGVGLRDGAQLLVDSVGYGTATNAFIEGAVAPSPPNGQSLARKPNGADTNHNEVDFVASTPTPRAAN
ncbi:MAG TPA: lamin tail domain-containing protein [Polyangia bacterium]